MRACALFALALISGGLTGALGPGVPVSRALSLIEVTSTGDAGTGGGAVCPDAELCTLRRAIELANADENPGPFTITFARSMFPPGAPGAIRVGNQPLPNVTRPGVTVDASEAGVEVVNASTSLTAVTNGLTATGAGFAVRGLHIHGFAGSCIAATSEAAVIGGTLTGAGNTLGSCATGVAVSGLNATIQGNLIGLTPGGAADPVGSGIVVAAGGATVGGPLATPGAANRIGFADTAIFVGSGSPSAFSGVYIERNVIGRRPAGDAAGVTTGIALSQPSGGTAVIANTIANVRTGIAVSPDAGGVAVVRNRLAGNVFANVVGMAIDLGADGVRDDNDPGDGDAGPNVRLNHPVLGRATQVRLTGTACPGCQVQVYFAAHEPGGAADYGLGPLPGGTVMADSSGAFYLDNPAAGPGEWLTAIATDVEGNTSEFGPSTRVGAGAVLCGNVQLEPGWNHAAYFGSEPAPLLNEFTPAAGAVTAIYRFLDGTDEFERWFSATTAGRTLATVEPGESYWFYATRPVTLPGGFSISFPLPVQLRPGWNDIVYLGASAAVADALGSLGGGFDGLHRFDPATGGWLRFGGTQVPSWAQEFHDLDACGVYQLRLEATAMLIPLQP